QGGIDRGILTARRRAPPVLPPAQDLPLLGRKRPEDRLQGREAPAALRLRARQNRTEPHHRRFGEKAARARTGHQARALSRPAALRDPVTRRMRPPDACGRMYYSPTITRRRDHPGRRWLGWTHMPPLTAREERDSS